jgi:WD40 repeat protein
LYSNCTQCGSTSSSPAPVIAVRFAPTLCGFHIRSPNSLVAVGCMDGSVTSKSSSNNNNSTDGSKLITKKVQSNITCQTVQSITDHTKYVRDIAWSPTHPIVTSASADGTVQLYSVTSNDNDDNYDDTTTIVAKYRTKSIQNLHFTGSVECITYTGDGTKLVCYSRGTPYLSIFDRQNEYQLTKINLNQLDTNATTGGFSDHVSYSIMDMSFSPVQQYCNTILGYIILDE